MVDTLRKVTSPPVELLDSEGNVLPSQHNEMVDRLGGEAKLAGNKYVITDNDGNFSTSNSTSALIPFRLDNGAGTMPGLNDEYAIVGTIEPPTLSYIMPIVLNVRADLGQSAQENSNITVIAIITLEDDTTDENLIIGWTNADWNSSFFNLVSGTNFTSAQTNVGIPMNNILFANKRIKKIELSASTDELDSEVLIGWSFFGFEY